VDKKFDISIVIPAKNEENNLKALLGDIKKQKLKISRRENLKIEIIVADAESTDKTREVARESGARVVKGGHAYFGRNQGVKIAGAPIVYLMDADIRVGRNFIRNSIKEFGKKKFDIALMDNYPWWVGRENIIERFLLASLFWLTNQISRLLHKTKKPIGISTCFICQRDVYLKIGGFDQKIYCQGDTEMVERLVAKGYRLGVLNNVFIWASTRKPLKQGILNYYLRALLIAKHRAAVGEVRSRDEYRKITGEEDYFKK
jgi:glycosyltransferase involved in cell wall biosynthesis